MASIFKISSTRLMILYLNCTRCMVMHKFKRVNIRAVGHWDLEKRLSSCLSYRLLATFLPEMQRLSPAKNFYSLSFCDENKSQRRSALLTETSVNFPPENCLCPCESQTVNCSLMVIM